MKSKYYITTAIDYVNSTPHIGTAYEKIGADAIARFQRLNGLDVRFQMGNDEHSINVKKAADAEGVKPKEYCDRMEEKFTSVWKELNIGYDGFIRTTDPEHVRAVQALYKIIMEKGDIYPSTYEGWYCESCEAFLTDKDLVDGKCPNHKTKPRWLKENNYFFALSKYQTKLLSHIKEHPEFILPEVRRNEVVTMIEAGLNDISASRSSFDWGVPLPSDPKHVVYVWIDALINYITAAGFGTNEKRFKKWWPADVHVIGKDIIRFHCVIWPAMLMSAGLPLPKTVFAHGFVYLKGEKMSKSLGNVLAPLDVTKKYGEDPLRYYLLREVPFGRDADFTWGNFINRYNGDLANGIGNLVRRTIGMASQYLEGEIEGLKNTKDKRDMELKDKISGVPASVIDAMTFKASGLHMNTAIGNIWEGITAADRYINENKPWELKKAGDTDRINIVISHVAESLRVLTILLYPFLPRTAENIWRQFGFESIGKLDEQRMEDAKKWGILKKKIKIKAGPALFPRIEEEREEKKMDENLIDISEFAKADLRIAEVKAAEKILGADNLLKLKINLGFEERQIVAGIAKAYKAEELIGKKIVVVANLKPARLKGVESKGMLLAASEGENIAILTPLRDVPAGTKVK